MSAPEVLPTRIALEFPQQRGDGFSVELDVRYTDVNIGRHLGADKMVAMLSEARDRFFAHHGHPDCEPGQVYTLMTELVVLYHAEVPPRTSLRFELALGDFNRYGANLYTRVTRGGDGVVAATARSGFVFFDSQTGTVAPMPEAFRHRFD